MTWLAPIPLFPEVGAESAVIWPAVLPTPRATPSRDPIARGMASVNAAPNWRWATTLPVAKAYGAPLTAEPSRVRIPADLVRRMSQEARLSGKSEGEVWAEAARAWLQRRDRDDDLPPTPPAAAQACPRPERTAWVAIDALLVDLRARPCEAA